MKAWAPWLLALSSLLLTWSAAAEAPRVSLGPLPQTVRVGEPFTLQVDVSWAGDPQALSVVGVELGAAPGVEVGHVTHSKRAAGGQTTHTVTEELRLTVPGEQSFGPVSVQYRDTEGEALSLEIPGTLSVVVLPEGGLKDRWLGLGFLVVLGAGAMVWRHHRNKPPPPPPPPPDPTTGERLERCKTYVRDGDLAEALEELARVKAQLPAPDDPLPPAAALEAEAMKVRFGGFPGDRHQIERWIRAAEVASRSASRGDADPHGGEG